MRNGQGTSTLWLGTDELPEAAHAMGIEAPATAAAREAIAHAHAFECEGGERDANEIEALCEAAVAAVEKHERPVRRWVLSPEPALARGLTKVLARRGAPTCVWVDARVRWAVPPADGERPFARRTVAEHRWWALADPQGVLGARYRCVTPAPVAIGAAIAMQRSEARATALDLVRAATQVAATGVLARPRAAMVEPWGQALARAGIELAIPVLRTRTDPADTDPGAPEERQLQPREHVTVRALARPWA